MNWIYILGIAVILYLIGSLRVLRHLTPSSHLSALNANRGQKGSNRLR